MSLRAGSNAVLAFTSVTGADGGNLTVPAAPAWAVGDYDIDDVVTISSNVYKCIRAHTASGSAPTGAAIAAAGWKRVPSQAVLPLLSFSLNDTGTSTTQLFQDEGGQARNLATSGTATVNISFAEVQGRKGSATATATAVQDLLQRRHRGTVTIWRNGYPGKAGDLKVEFTAQVQDRTDQTSDNFAQVDVVLGVVGTITRSRLAADES